MSYGSKLEEEFMQIDARLVNSWTVHALALLAALSSWACLAREPNDMEIGAFIASFEEIIQDSPEIFDDLSSFPIKVVDSSCKESLWGYDYKVRIVVGKTMTSFQSDNYDVQAPDCDAHFSSLLQPALIGSMAFRIDPARAYPVPDIRKYWNASFDIRAPLNTYFLGGYLYPLGTEMYMTQLSDHSFKELIHGRKNYCEYLETGLGGVSFGVGECTNHRFAVLYIARIGRRTIIYGARQ